MSDAFDDLFAHEEGSLSPPSPGTLPPWKVLIVDDDAEVHQVTRIALKGFSFEGRGLAFTSAYSAREARAALLDNPDTALILLDVVMEDEEAGLDFVRVVREEMGNILVRIVLRTGYPGQAPERRVILDYDINDYKTKTELTDLKLFTTVVASLRAFRNYSDLDAHRQRLERLARAAEEANRAKSAFLANMSHDIRSPMNAVIGMTDLALASDLSPEQRQYMEIVQQSSESLLSLINGILDFSKIEAGRLELEQIPFNLREVVESVCETLAVQAHQKGLELVHHLSPGLWPHYLGDGGRLRQVLVNLLANAIKFTRRGEVVITVADGGPQDGDERRRLHFIIRDTGVGIPQEKIAAIFKQFSQADRSTAREFGGSGLGLAICERLVGLMGGTISVTSTPQEGSIFRFSIVVPKAEGPALAAVNWGEAPLPRLLVASANQAQREMLADSLQGVQVVMAEGGNAACERLAADQAFDAVLFDIRMPDLGGLLLAERLREGLGERGGLIAMLPTSHREGDRQRLRELGVCISLLKPPKLALLLGAVEMALGRGDPAGETARQAHPAQECQGALRILLAEDQPDHRRLAEEVLTAAGHGVRAVADGAGVLATLSAESFDLLLLDMEIAPPDGLTLVRLIRAGEVPGCEADLPVGMVTARALVEDRQACQQAGVDEFLPKPYKTAQLVHMAQRLGQRSHKRQRVRVSPLLRRIVGETSVLSRVRAEDRQVIDKRALFPERSSAAFKLMEAAIIGRDPEELERETLWLKEDAAVVGAGRLKNALMRLLLAARKGDLQQAARLLDKAREEWTAVLQALREKE